MRNGCNWLWSNLKWVSHVQHLKLPNIIHATGQSARQAPNQNLKAYSFPLDDAESSASALEAACSGNGGKFPDAVFLCAGVSRPGFFVEEDEVSLRRGMDNGYWVQAWSALVRHPVLLMPTLTRAIQAAAKRMARDKFPGKIVFIGLTLWRRGVDASIVGHRSEHEGYLARQGFFEPKNSGASEQR
ncbi:hypothetical protein C0995_002867 [Termitomyces sp. Mi166|nr:hypothetical protein C0995_002867 [Termitomyces sp. Mi166\